MNAKEIDARCASLLVEPGTSDYYSAGGILMSVLGAAADDLRGKDRNALAYAANRLVRVAYERGQAKINQQTIARENAELHAKANALAKHKLQRLLDDWGDEDE
jgi:hypothetical protein